MAYLRAGILALSSAVSMVVFILHVAITGKKSLTFPYLRYWSNLLLKTTGVTLQVEGAEYCTGQVVLVGNHISQFDIPAVVIACPLQARIIYKKELQSVPFLGWCLKMSDFIPVSRNDGRDAHGALQRMLALIHSSSESLIIFAEGTRSPDGTLQPFKRGAFVVASQSKLPIVPFVVIGSNGVLAPGESIPKKGTITVRFGEPIPPSQSEVTRAGELVLMQRVHDAVRALQQG